MSSSTRNAPGRGIEYVAPDVYFNQAVWDDNLMTWVPQTVSAGVGDAVTVTNIPHVIVDSLPAEGGGLTDTELRATAVPVSLATAPTTPVTGPLTDTQLRAVAVPVSLAAVPSHPVTNAGTFAVQATGDFYPVTQPVSIATMPSTPVTGPLTDTELRAVAVPVSAAALPLPADAASNTTLALLTLAQNAAAADQAGPMVQGRVSDSPESYTAATIQPLSLTPEGRLRVSSVEADITRVWQQTFDDPWTFSDPWAQESLYV